MNGYVESLACLAAVLTVVGCGNRSATAGGAAPPVPGEKRLREIVSQNYKPGSVLIGATIGAESLGKPLAVILDREFGYVTPENDFKHQAVRGNPKAWN